MMSGRWNERGGISSPARQGWLRFRSYCRPLALALCLIAFSHLASAALLCSIPGKDGPGTPSGIINTYYPGASSVSAGATSIPVGFPSGDLSKMITTGDLLLVIQMQDADISSSNDWNYGANNTTGRGYTSLNLTGVYEYVTAAGPVSGGSVPITSNLANSYRSRAASVANGQSIFQVIRVPQYSTASVSGTVLALLWNGTVGGVVVMDVAGTLTISGKITADGAGFRGGWGEFSNTTGPDTDYRTRAIVLGNGMKGEGIAGTPNRMNQPTSFNGAPNLTTSGTSLGYPDGANTDAAKGRGAPGNAGGGGTDGNIGNDENSGGGGGGNYAAGAKGGNSWSSNLPVGGEGGSAVTGLAFNRIVMGGGGGAGTTNNGTADNATYTNPPGFACTDGGLSGMCSSGAPGGGIVLLRANSIGGSGSITTNGGSGYNVGNDSAGGGGAGGSVVIYTQTGCSIPTVTASGGDGGNAWRSHTIPDDRHGPGGGGSGGFVAYSPATGFTSGVTVNGGTSGKSCNDDAYGSTSSAGGIYTFQSPNTSGPKPGAACLPLLTVTKSTSTPNITTLPGTAIYTINVSNASGTSTATNVTLSDTLPGAPALFTNRSAAPISITYTPSSAPCNTSRKSTTNAATGVSTPAWSSWDIPSGCTVGLQFDVTAPAGTIASVYQNPATVTYDDPVNIGQRLSSSYNPLSSTAEDVKILAPPAVAKSFGAASIIAGGNTTVRVTLTNPNSADITGVTFTDTLPTTASGAPGNMTIVNPPVPTTTCLGVPTITAINGSGTFTVGGSGYTVPANSSCTVQFTITAPTAGIYVNTIPAGNLSSSNGSNSNPATASLTVGPGLLPPTIAKLFVQNPILIGGTSTLRFTLTNSNALAAIGSAGFIDTLPPELVVAAIPNVTNGCGGTVTAVAGTGYISLNTNGTIPAGAPGACQVSVDVTSTTPGIYANTTGQVAGDTGAGNRATNTLVVMAPLVVAKSFATNPVAVNTATGLTITLTNPNSVPVTGATFADTYPAGLVNTASPSATTTCGGAPTITATNGGTSLVVGGSGATVPANSSCTVTVNVQAATSGSYANSTGAVATANAGASPAGVATLNVLSPAIVLKSFTPQQINNNGQSNLQIIIGNPSTNAAPLTGVALTDTYTGTLTNAAAYTSLICTDGSTATISGGANGGTTVGITGGTIQPGGTCTINQLVTATSSTTNTTAAPTSTNGGAGTAATAYLAVTQPLRVSKSFENPLLTVINNIATQTNFYMRIVLENPNPVAVNGISFTDTYPVIPSSLSTITNANTPTLTFTPANCLGAGVTATAAANGASLAITNGTLAANATCNITVRLRFPGASGSAADNQTVTNNTGPVTTTNAGASLGDSAAIAVGTGIRRVNLTKSFLTNPININGATTTTTLQFVVTNPATVAANTIAFTDTLPAGLTATNATQSVCGGVNNFTITGGNLLSLTGGTLAAAGSCTISVATVSGSVPGVYVNRTGQITASTGTGNYAEATLDVNYPPVVTKSFGSNSFTSGGSTTLTINFMNANPVAITTTANFDDVFPTSPGAMTLFNGTLVNNTCGFTPTDTAGGALGAGDTGIRVPNGSSIPAGGCYFTVNVTASIAGNYTNTTPVLHTAAGDGSAASAPVSVVAQPPLVSKAFSPATVSTGVTSTLIITLANPNAATISLNALLSDTFPAGITTAATPNRSTTCYTSSGALAAVGGTASTVTLASGAIVPAGTPSNPGTCTFQVDVTAAATGVYTNTILTGDLKTTAGNNAAAATAVLTVPASTPPTVSKAFGDTTISTGTKTTLTITLGNTNLSPATLSANLDDTLPANLIVATPNGLTGTCAGSITATPGSSHVIYNSGTTIPAGGCTIVVNVTSTTAGAYTNTIAAGALQTTNLGNSPGPTSDILTVVAANLTVLKTAFGVTSGATAKAGQDIPYVITVTNTGAGKAWEVNVTDALSIYSALKLNTLAFTDGGISSGLSMTNSTTSYSYDNGATWSTTAPADLGGGYNGTVTNWRIVFDPAVLMNGNNAFFTISYRAMVK
jgi:uncharacterized repeat protein (TIGR01451 family)